MSAKSKQSTILVRLFDSFILEKTILNKSPSTVESYRTSFRVLQSTMPELFDGKVKPSKSLFLEFAHRLQAKGLSLATVNHYLRDARVFFYWAIEEGYLEPFKVMCIKDTTPNKQPFSSADMKRLLIPPGSSAPFIMWRDWAIVNMVYGTSVRASTVVNMHMSDIDYKADIITLRHTKNNKMATEILVPTLKKALLKYLHRREVESEYLFPSYRGTKLTPNGLSQSMAKYAEQRGIEKRGIHRIRHTFGKEFAAAGGDVYDLQRIMTHRDIRTTQRYIDLYGNHERRDRLIKVNPLEIASKNN